MLKYYFIDTNFVVLVGPYERYGRGPYGRYGRLILEIWEIEMVDAVGKYGRYGRLIWEIWPIW